MKEINLVYIVEDDAIASFVIKKIIEDHPSIKESVVFRDGQLAMEALLDLKNKCLSMPDLLLLDINMPTMDAWQFLDAWSHFNITNPIQVVILTSSIDPCDIAKAKTYKQVLGYFLKPFNQDKLNEIIKLHV